LKVRNNLLLGDSIKPAAEYLPQGRIFTAKPRTQRKKSIKNTLCKSSMTGIGLLIADAEIASKDWKERPIFLAKTPDVSLRGGFATKQSP
jgi:hypothetical protein